MNTREIKSVHNYYVRRLNYWKDKIVSITERAGQRANQPFRRISFYEEEAHDLQTAIFKAAYYEGLIKFINQYKRRPEKSEKDLIVKSAFKSVHELVGQDKYWSYQPNQEAQK